MEREQRAERDLRLHQGVAEPVLKEATMFDRTHASGRSSSAMRLATTALTIALLVATTTLASAQAGNAGATNKKALVGSWIETVTFPPASGRPPLKSLGSFHDDQTFVCSDQGAVTTGPSSPSVFTSCHGVWTHLGQRDFAYTSFELISDLDGNLVGYLKVRGIYKVSQSGNEYTGISFAQILDTDGNVLFSIDVTNEGRRILVELP
jgi:hypothetical protein